MKKVGVAKLVGVLYHGAGSGFVPEKYLRDGNYWHTKLGYYESIYFARYYNYNGEHYLIIGNPDKIEEDTIAELKVAFSPKRVKLQREKGETQANIYAWMADFPFHRCDVYSFRENKLMFGEVRETDTEKAEADVHEGIRLLKKVKSVHLRRAAGKTLEGC